MELVLYLQARSGEATRKNPDLPQSYLSLFLRTEYADG